MSKSMSKSMSYIKSLYMLNSKRRRKIARPRYNLGIITTLPWYTQYTVGQEDVVTNLTLSTRLRNVMEDSTLARSFQQYRVLQVKVQFIPQTYTGTAPSPIVATWNDTTTANRTNPLKMPSKIISNNKTSTMTYTIKGRNNEMGVWQDINEDPKLSLILSLATCMPQDVQTEASTYMFRVLFKIQLRHPVNKPIDEMNINYVELGDGKTCPELEPIPLKKTKYQLPLIKGK